MANTMGFAEAKSNFSNVAGGTNRAEWPVAAMKDNNLRVMIERTSAKEAEVPDAISAAAGFMDEYADVFEELAR